MKEEIKQIVIEAPAPAIVQTVAAIAAPGKGSVVKSQTTLINSNSPFNVADSVYIGRNVKTYPNNYGNPYSHIAGKGIQTPDAHSAFLYFEEWLYGRRDVNAEQEHRKWIIAQLEAGALVDKKIVCYAHGGHCHGETLRDISNGVKPMPTMSTPGEGSVVKSEANSITEPEPIVPTVTTAQPVQAPSAQPTTPAPAAQHAPTAQPKPYVIPDYKLTKIKTLIEQLTDEQKVAFAAICNDMVNSFLTGKGGAGKSFLVDIIRKCYDLAGFPYIVIGSTGTSVVNIDGHNTFNGMFGLGKGFEDNEDEQDITRTEQQWDKLVTDCRNGKYFKKQLPHLKDKMAKTGRPLLIILDEVSQSDSLLLSAVEYALTEKMKVAHQWLLVGDPMQFEPVKGNYFFKDVKVVAADGSKVVKQSIFNKPGLNFIGFNLKDNMRAKGDLVWSNAMDVIRMHHIQDDLPEIIKERWEHSENNAAPANAIVVALANKTVNRFNRVATQKLLASGAQSKKYIGVIDTKVHVVGQPADYWLYQNEFSRNNDDTVFAPISKYLTLCVGMRVMMRAANLKTKSGDMLVNNGQTGTVLFLGDNYVRVKFDNGVTEDVKRVSMEDPQKRGTMDQIPLMPAYAITIAKTQGMTLDVPVIFHMYSENRNGTVTPVNADNAFYVALSRLTTSDNCWFYTKQEAIDWHTKSRLTPYEALKKSFRTNIEALEFTYNLK